MALRCIAHRTRCIGLRKNEDVILVFGVLRRYSQEEHDDWATAIAGKKAPHTPRLDPVPVGRRANGAGNWANATGGSASTEALLKNQDDVS
ncbi:unnamed protein product [Heligmosomoides polygyrus]|uniref:Transposase n=1 Tax=Heligmosomoides polygyrus TaxID=6339 RepID=A0A183FLE8_HELPZ|nr:unnamed protein product [Heligmosomoides polygyrus]